MAVVDVMSVDDWSEVAIDRSEMGHICCSVSLSLMTHSTMLSKLEEESRSRLLRAFCPGRLSSVVLLAPTPVWMKSDNPWRASYCSDANSSQSNKFERPVGLSGQYFNKRSLELDFVVEVSTAVGFWP